MKIFLMTDMEGVAGIVGFDEWATREGNYYELGKSLLTAEANAAIEGFYAAGATEIVVVDGHGAGGIHPLQLDDRVSYLRGPVPGPYPFLLDASFDAMAWVGQHAKAGTEEAHMAHTGWFDVKDMFINGRSVGEFGLMAMIGTLMNVQPIFGSGDEAFTREASDLVPGIETVSVKRGVMQGTGEACTTDQYRIRNDGAIHLHPHQARIRIRDGAERALNRFIRDRASFDKPEIISPYHYAIHYRQDGDVQPRIVEYEGENDLIALLNRALEEKK
ncbi:M55 family metallopeptidase [Paenibacillus sp. J5C_2022]|uniref:M55 family metallopeptidase n=1 Tax=Paenibacillus sp. J5C2022 TaxID=2977129 RepID=UPI0021D3A60E|nr:M55 family metallopeptidase [Paenibacillus sp. J5C2022]MCU6708812.1 M55 family metallopeptidase [Paenibacillus sp. J5C2022]